MIGVIFLIRLIEVALALVILGLVLVGFAWLLNRGIQFVADQLGYEVRDFFGYIRELLPKRKEKS